MVNDLAIATGFPIQLIVSRGSNVFQAHDPSSLRCGLHRARESVCRASGFVQVGFEEVCAEQHSPGLVAIKRRNDDQSAGRFR